MRRIVCRSLYAAFWLLPSLVWAQGEAVPYPAVLPPQEQVIRVLEQQPLFAAARSGIAMEEANRQGLVAGSYEWTLRATSQRRKEIAGTNYYENGIALERPLRWGSKAGKDAQLGDSGVRLSELRLADAWHEAARSLMRGWFDWLREARTAARLQQNAQLLDRQLHIVGQRVKAGDAPRMELALVETERDRAQAAAMAAMQRRDLILAALSSRYPGLNVAVPDTLPEPAPLARSAAQWREEILAENHEVGVARAEAEQSRLAAERAALDRVPDPTVGVHYMEERSRQERILGMSLSFPIPGAARSAQSLASASRAEIAADHAREVKLKVEADATQAAMRAESAQALWRQMDAISRQAEANAALASRAYALGELGLNESLLARRQALDALTNAEQSRIDALEAQARLLLDAHRIWDREGM
jgi:outer membrane protein TolC